MVTGHIMELHTIIVEVVEHSKTGLIPLSVVRLGSSSSETSCDGQMVSNKYHTKANEKEGESVSGSGRKWKFYVCMKPVYFHLPRQHRQRQLLSGYVTFFDVCYLLN